MFGKVVCIAVEYVYQAVEFQSWVVPDLIQMKIYRGDSETVLVVHSSSW